MNNTNFKDLYIDIELLKKIAPRISEHLLCDHEKEFQEMVYHRLISTLIPYKLPSEDPLKLQKYFVKKLEKRTGEKYDTTNQLVNQLVIKTIMFHTKRSNINTTPKSDICANCKYDFQNGYIGLNNNMIDIFNPGTHPTQIVLEAHLDHISPITKNGNNSSANMQWLCSVCNSGKSDICSLIDKFNVYNDRVHIDEVEKLKNDITKYKSFLKKSLFYRVLARDKVCKFCNTSDYSLTIMPVDKETLYTYDNLITICYNCLEKNDTVSNVRWLEKD